ncbi:hypothetical protein HOE425_280009 [Hoeflea sp. EC-HK425]|nr:hypothetical protein HOE425_280009 [Hoeflea sp. EC-HK425]
MHPLQIAGLKAGYVLLGENRQIRQTRLGLSEIRGRVNFLEYSKTRNEKPAEGAGHP